MGSIPGLGSAGRSFFDSVEETEKATQRQINSTELTCDIFISMESRMKTPSLEDLIKG